MSEPLFSVFGLTVTWWDILTQGLGAIGILASFLLFQCRTHRNVLLFRTLNEAFFGVQYILLGAYTGAGMNAVGCLRNIVFSRRVRQKKSNTPFMVLFSALFVIGGIFTWQGPKSLLIIFAKVLSTIGYSLKNLRLLRLTIFITCSCWLIYNIFVGSIAGILCEAFSLFSIIIAAIRMDLIPLFRKH